MESVHIKDYMNHYPVTFSPQMVIEEASFRFLKTKQMGGPVVDANQKLVGFLSESDVLAKMLETIYHNEHIANVADIMRTDVLAVKPTDSILELGQNMLLNKPKVYPVVDEDGKVIGTICRNDVLMAIDKHLRSNYQKLA
jgi:predicted transcriptional regulator